MAQAYLVSDVNSSLMFPSAGELIVLATGRSIGDITVTWKDAENCAKEVKRLDTLAILR